jgi:hypothetical protein
MIGRVSRLYLTAAGGAYVLSDASTAAFSFKFRSAFVSSVATKPDASSVSTTRIEGGASVCDFLRGPLVPLDGSFRLGNIGFSWTESGTRKDER